MTERIATGCVGLDDILNGGIPANTITVLMGAAHFHHIASEFLLTPATVVRTNHDDPQTLVHLWSTFARPEGSARRW